MKKKTRSFRYQMYLLFVGSITVPILIVANLLSLFYNQRLRAENELSAVNTLNMVASSVQTHFTELDRISFTPYLYKDIQTFFGYMKNGFVVDPPSYLLIGGSETNYVLTMSKLMFTSHMNIQSIVFYPESGDHTYAITRTTAGLQALREAGYRQQDWYLAAAREAPTYLMLPSQTNILGVEKQYFTRVQMIVDPDSQKNLGVLRIDVSLDKLDDILQAIELPRDSSLLLCDGGGSIHLNNNNGSSEHPDKGAYLEDPAFIAFEAPIENSNWSLVYLTQTSSLWRTQLYTFLLAFLLCAAVTIVAFLIYRLESEKTVLAVQDILGTLTRIQGGDFDARSSVSSRTELAQISEGINEMGGKIKTHIQSEYTAVIDRQNAEYRALQAQINPHFLYNTLNDFVALNRMNERGLLEESIFRLTNMFRYSCTPGDTTTVGSEVAFCEQYLQLRKLQLDDRLQYAVNIAPGCESRVIPKLILQPLVENAVVHGMDDAVERLTVHIKVACPQEEESRVEIVVEDDGRGFDPDSLAEDTSRVGVSNVRERLEIFSAGSTLSIKSHPGEGTRCTLVIMQKEKCHGYTDRR